MAACDYCPKPVPEGQRFCCDRHRAAWHRENVLHGIVSGIRRTKRGWSITARYQNLPEGLHIGCTAWCEKAPSTRTDASHGDETTTDAPCHEPPPDNATSTGGNDGHS